MTMIMMMKMMIMISEGREEEHTQTSIISSCRIVRPDFPPCHKQQTTPTPTTATTVSPVVTWLVGCDCVYFFFISHASGRLDSFYQQQQQQHDNNDNNNNIIIIAATTSNKQQATILSSIVWFYSKWIVFVCVFYFVEKQ